MSTTPFEFGKQLDEWVKSVEMDHSELCVRFALLVGGKIVARTPYLTGRARASWNGSLEKAVRSTTRKGRKQPEYEDPAVAAKLFQDKFMDRLRGYIQIVGSQKPPIYIVNRLPYIVFLERGTSQKAPQGMVAVTLAEVQANFGEVRDVKLVGPVSVQVA
ncbi:MAG: hypothetical protein E6R03_16315 [Hyphomicrobiaceae bacterium]|nr:MAG: hypothetical protein E6R03_16315 [Hyphomicrobiaceae bacterium]